jgi:hypothetical protein
MTAGGTEYFFRVRENGAVVFRIDPESPTRRIEMTQIAVVNVKNGEIRPHGDGVLSEADRKAVEDWLERRRDVLRARELGEIEKTVEQLNLAANWVQQKATPEDLERVSDALLLAMHDLRTILVRKASDRPSEDGD